MCAPDKKFNSINVCDFFFAAKNQNIEQNRNKANKWNCPEFFFRHFAFTISETLHIKINQTFNMHVVMFPLTRTQHLSIDHCIFNYSCICHNNCVGYWKCQWLRLVLFCMCCGSHFYLFSYRMTSCFFCVSFHSLSHSRSLSHVSKGARLSKADLFCEWTFIIATKRTSNILDLAMNLLAFVLLHLVSFGFILLISFNVHTLSGAWFYSHSQANYNKILFFFRRENHTQREQFFHWHCLRFRYREVIRTANKR